MFFTFTFPSTNEAFNFCFESGFGKGVESGLKGSFLFFSTFSVSYFVVGLFIEKKEYIDFEICFDNQHYFLGKLFDEEHDDNSFVHLI